MITGEIYKIQTGEYVEKYLVINHSDFAFELRRVRFPKSKMDGIRLPISFLIRKDGQIAIPENKPKKQKK